MPLSKPSKIYICIMVMIFLGYAYKHLNPDPSRQYREFQDEILQSNAGYVSKVDIVKSEIDNLHYWRIRFFVNDVLISVDDHSFPARFNAYWTWDDSNRFWIYETDTAQLYYWKFARGSFVKSKWASADPIYPPDVFKNAGFERSRNQ